ncbi:phosphodiester glycosidase family protein [Streptomyces sp. NPDC049915]|uniref:phosphodiester glycosidase family protein n=1 Tax=Streptomyces sp. NPDC049915 TaxID=3155510 RepID=UPI00342DBFA9
MTLDELARILLDLGAVDGLNLDGGGSTTLVVEQTVRNRPSDATGERAVATACTSATAVTACTPTDATVRRGLPLARHDACGVPQVIPILGRGR